MLPFAVLENIDRSVISKWEKCFVDTGRKFSNGLWFRTQEECNMDYSGWRRDSDKRRRLIQFYDEYGVVGNKFCILNCYLWMSLAFPKEEISKYVENIKRLLKQGSWRKKNAICYEKEDLEFIFKEERELQEDIICKRNFPENYHFLTITLKSKGYKIPKDVLDLPWKLFNQGIRTPDQRETPTYSKDLSILKKYLPAQIELGCGPSIEAGIDPLYSYHTIYSVQDHKTKKFFLSPDSDTILYDLLSDTNQYLVKISQMYRKMLLAEPTSFHYVLREMVEKGLIVEPILSNNFDGLCEQVGMQTIFVRDYLKYFRFKEFEFNPKAKSYLVFGCHSDRRFLQKLARERGLKVIYIDPEFFKEEGKYRSYPLEGPKDEDIVINMTCAEFINNYKKTFSI